MCWPRAGPSCGLPGDGQGVHTTWVCKRQEVTFSPQTPPPGSPHSHPGPGGCPELQGRDIVPQPGGECPVAICLALASCRSVGGHSRLGVCVCACLSFLHCPCRPWALLSVCWEYWQGCVPVCTALCSAPGHGTAGACGNLVFIFPGSSLPAGPRVHCGPFLGAVGRAL